MKVFKETIVMVAGLLMLAMIAPTAMAAGDAGTECCENNPSQSAKIDGQLNVNDVAGYVMKVALKQMAGEDLVAHDGSVLLGEGEAERTIYVDSWFFDRNGEGDLSSAPIVSLTDGTDDVAGTTITDVTPDDAPGMDGFKLFRHKLVVPNGLAGAEYTVSVDPTQIAGLYGATVVDTPVAVYNTVHWAIDAASVDFGAIDPGVTDVTTDSFTISNLHTSAFSVDIHMDDLALEGSTYTIPTAGNVFVQSLDDAAWTNVKAFDANGLASSVATLDDDSSTSELRFKLVDPAAGNTNGVVPQGTYNTVFCILITANGSGDFLYKEDGDEYDQSGGADTTPWANPAATSANGPDGKGDLAFPTDY